MTLPTGEIAFLFTDIEGSTRLLQRLGQGYAEVLEAHKRIIRRCVQTAGGVEVNTTGDGFFAAFETVAAAADAAVSAQRGLAAHLWPVGGCVRVRMGLHVGAASIGTDGYVGLDVHRAARICAAGYGGQVLLSVKARDALTPAASDLALRDLGEHRLKDLELPERLFQLVVSDLPSDFPPVRAAGSRPHNLPAEVSRFVGRQQALRDARGLLDDCRLLTILGPGGVGKTRLALRLAADALPAFEDGVFWVPLSEVRESRDVPSAVANALNVQGEIASTLEEAIAAHLMDKRLLLVLDNFEQVIGAARWLSGLLAGGPGLKALVTSRRRLQLAAEQAFDVPPMITAAEDPAAGSSALMRVEAVELFVSRVRAIDPAFALSEANAESVASLVARVEGLPLAIELAAARSRLFPPDVLLQRLNRRLNTLSGGPADLPERHRTLTETIAWSYELLDAQDRAMFRRLAVFAGGFTAEAAEDVAGESPVDDPLDGLQSLLDHSMVRSRIRHGERRFEMLETIREFALGKLAESGEAEAVAARLADCMTSLVEEAEPLLTRQSHGAIVQRLTAEQGNLRAALRHAQETGDAQTGLRLAAATWRYWHASGHLKEGRVWLEAFLSRAADADAALRAKGLSALGGLAYWQGDYAGALERYREALTIYRDIGDRHGEADTLFAISTTSTWSGDTRTGADLADQALSMFERLGERDKVGMVLMAQGFARWKEGDLAGARPLWERSREIAIEVGDEVEGSVKRLAIAAIDARCGRRGQALTDAMQAMEELLALKNVSFTVMALDWVAALAADDQPLAAARLAGAAHALREAYGGGMAPETSGLENARVAATRRMDRREVDLAWDSGLALGLQEAVACARTIGKAAKAPAAEG